MIPPDFSPLFSGTDAADAPIKLVAVRGALKIGYVKPDGLYDSLIFVIDKNADTVGVWLSSTDPSLALIANPINSAGAAQLRPGLWLYKPGIHKENPNWPCFVQAEDFVVNRLNSNGNVKGQDTGDFGIHLHSGGATDKTADFSAGCQIIHNGDGYFGDPTWSRFFKPIKSAMSEYGVKSLPYLLLNAADFKLPIPQASEFKNPVTP